MQSDITFCDTFKLKCPVSGTESAFSFIQTDECESGTILFRWLLYVLQFIREMSTEKNNSATKNPTLNLAKNAIKN